MCSWGRREHNFFISWLGRDITIIAFRIQSLFILMHWNNILLTVFFSLINPAVGGWLPVYKFLVFEPKWNFPVSCIHWITSVTNVSEKKSKNVVGATVESLNPPLTSNEISITCWSSLCFSCRLMQFLHLPRQKALIWLIKDSK